MGGAVKQAWLELRTAAVGFVLVITGFGFIGFVAGDWSLPDGLRWAVACLGLVLAISGGWLARRSIE